ncbi:uncharacterized protein LAJ45_02297 [Morchella importuna]|uniref:uncharacterized protein n=1 Tax=Morchella importuna TaxID=1174673 RepID=UPI001E8DB749|nr:uncharacterized protein LAJ45_02297 [Morchella importuna]KAH8153484.1 hypothetical protein LAJ45_02297 [Morchella importuna]
MLFLSSSLPRTVLTLGMAIDSSASVSEDKGFNFAVELDPQTFDAVDAFRFDHDTSNVDFTTQELDLDNPENDGPDNDDSKDVDFTNTLSRRGLEPVLFPVLSCETSDASPYVKDVYDIADWVGNRKLQGQWDCRQTNIGGSKCHRVQWSGSAEAALCGPYGLVVRCNVFADRVRTIADRCARKGKAGGKLVFTTSGASIIVYHKSR